MIESKLQNIEKKGNITRKMIPSLTISMEMLVKLCTILDREFNRKKMGILADQKCFVKYQFKGNSYENIRESASAIRDLSIKGIKEVFLEFSCENKLITIRFDLKRDYLSEYRVQGKDPMWVDEIANNIDTVFVKHTTPNDLFHLHWKRALPLYALMTAILCYFLDVLIYYTMQINDVTRDFNINYVVLYLSLVGPMMLCWHEMFQRLFPKFSA